MSDDNPIARRRALGDAIALAGGGEPAAVERAAELFRGTDYYGLVEHHAAYARLGSAQEDEAATYLAGHVDKNPYSPRTSAAMLTAIMRLGPAQAPKAHQALANLQAAWAATPLVKTCLGIFCRPLATVDPAFAPDVVHEALRSLRVDPERFLPHRDATWIMRRELRVVDELAAGTADQQALLAATLTGLADDVSLAPLLRHRAVAALERVDPPAARAAGDRLRAAGVADPGEPVPDPHVVAAVDGYWQRIETAMRAHAPHLLANLGPGLPAAEVAVCRQILGIPDAFGASLARHRYARLWPAELHYEDVRAMLADVDEEWWQDDGDWGDLPDLDSDAAWLDCLRVEAERLEAG